WEQKTGKSLELRAGSAPELYERIRSEGSDTTAYLRVTTVRANLWRAKEAGMLESISTQALEAQVPSEYRDPDEQWWGLSLRIRTPMRSTERVDAGAIKPNEDPGK